MDPSSPAEESESGQSQKQNQSQQALALIEPPVYFFLVLFGCCFPFFFRSVPFFFFFLFLFDHCLLCVQLEKSSYVERGSFISEP